MAPAGADLLRSKAGIDHAPCGEVVTAQRRNQGARRQPPGRCGLAFASRPWQGVEDVLGSLETPFENLDEGDLGRMDRRRRRQAPAGVDHRLGRARGVDHMAQAAGQRVVDVGLGQRSQDVGRQRLGEETPVIRAWVVVDQLVEIAEVAGDRVAAKQRLVHERVRAGTRTGRLERAQNRFQATTLRRLAGQRHGPLGSRADPGVGRPSWSEADPGIDDFLGATPDFRLRQRSSQKADPRPCEHFGDPRHTHGVRRNHAVDLRDQARWRRKDGIGVDRPRHRA